MVLTGSGAISLQRRRHDLLATPFTRMVQLGVAAVTCTSTIMEAPSDVLFVPDCIATVRFPPWPSGNVAQLWLASAVATSPETVQS
jgi:hypothetical protein